MAFDTISFLSDLGHGDESVGLVHSIVRSISPSTTVVDVSHGVQPFDVRGAALLLARSVQYLCPGVVVAAVDPGAGSDRRRIAVEVGGGASVLVGPDNGLLAPAVAMCGGASRAFELTNTDYHLPAPSKSFDVRDVFGPVAAHLCNGVALDELGTEVTAESLLPSTLPLTMTDGDALVCQVLWVDGFGNVQLNADMEEIEPLGADFVTRVHAKQRRVRRVNAFADLKPSELGLVIDGYGMPTLVANRASAAELVGASVDDEIMLEPGGPMESSDIDVPVSLGPRPTR